jgi:hypothetical protein
MFVVEEFVIRLVCANITIAEAVAPNGFMFIFENVY